MAKKNKTEAILLLFIVFVIAFITVTLTINVRAYLAAKELCRSQNGKFVTMPHLYHVCMRKDMVIEGER